MATNTKSIFDDIDASETEEISDRQRTIRLWKETFVSQWRTLSKQRSVQFSVAVIGLFVLMAILAPILAPYPPLERQYQSNGVLIAKWMKPSLLSTKSTFLLGTTAEGYDILSQLIYGTRTALLVGLLSAVFTAGIGTLVGLIAGYFGGYIDDLLMRIVDFLYGLPLLPTVIILVAVLGPSLLNIIAAVTLLQWRATARVVRSQALSLRERPFVKAAKIAGASDWYVISRHLLPNVLPMSFLYASFAIAWAILTQAGVAFLGMGDPNNISWGTMLQSARSYSALSFGAWWWFVPPGICIGLLVISGFLIGRGYEEVTNPELQS